MARINGRAVPASILREVGALLVNIHGQHDNQALLNPASHLSLVDLYAGDGAVLTAYSNAYDRLTAARRELEAAAVDESEKARRTEMLRYQLADIDGAKLKPGEEESLEARAAKLRNLELISRQSRLIRHALYRADKGMSSYDLIARAAAALEQISEFVPDADKYAARLDSIRAELEDIAERVTDACGADLDSDPTAELDRIEGRLDMITKLKRKYGADIDEILKFRARTAEELSKLENSDLRVAELKKELSSREAEIKTAADELTSVRRDAAARLWRRSPPSLRSSRCRALFLRSESAPPPSRTAARDIRAGVRMSLNSLSPPTPANLPSRWRKLHPAASCPELCSQ
jgi:DNA repair protein RecN (Recombination protein N)